VIDGAAEGQAAKLRQELVAGLVADRSLISDGWIAAFTEVPRHVFVPVYYRQSPTEQRVVDESALDEWLDGVYSDELLVIRPDVRSSSTVPSLMAAMLEALAAEDGDRVLEIGTGSGYNAALLSHRLGDDNVVSVDIDPELVADAESRLSVVGLQPTLGVGDGLAGWPPMAPYDRLIATCEPSVVPEAWLAQMLPGGRIVTPIATAIAVLDVDDPATASGRFLANPAFFMPMRSGQDPDDVGEIIRAVQSSDELGRDTSLGAHVWFDSQFQFLLAIAAPGLRFLATMDDGAALFTHPDGSWASVSDSVTIQAGPRRIWDVVERVHRLWNDLGHPTRDRFRLTVDGPNQRISLDGTDEAWLLP
jgi:protein-L-isoaspartate(D-aspartate) O-methyltransferase